MAFLCLCGLNIAVALFIGFLGVVDWKEPYAWLYVATPVIWMPHWGIAWLVLSIIRTTDSCEMAYKRDEVSKMVRLWYYQVPILLGAAWGLFCVFIQNGLDYPLWAMIPITATSVASLYVAYKRIYRHHPPQIAGWSYFITNGAS